MRAVDIPVSIKTRLGWDDDNRDWRELINIAAVRAEGLFVYRRNEYAQGLALRAEAEGDARLPDGHLHSGER